MRLGMALISGIREAAAQWIMAARAAAVFATVEDMAMRAELDGHVLRCLSGADALATLAGHRPSAVWEAIGIDTRPTEMLREARTFEDPVEFAEPAEGASIADDYASMGLTLRRHPLALLRGRLAARGVRTADNLRHRAREIHWLVAAMDGFIVHHAERQLYAADDNFLVNATAEGFILGSDVE
ncbi:hypothetical protein ACSFA2_00660 [Variovorax sp. LT2P21]|uniref:helix-hairpin-helix domain-containing protein n=1 Tax=Variovorax sp. LT2P21 TaxID=3443731 RepID=UPI003F47A85A